MTEFFEKRLHEFAQKTRELQGQERQIGTIRIVFFLAALILAVWWANARQADLLGLTVLVAVPIFLYLVQWHSRISGQRRHHQHLVQINQAEIKRLANQWKDLPANGAVYADPAHPYTGDLDIFGPASLFQYLNRTVTLVGADRLAAWLKHCATPAEIRERQTAGHELAAKVDWRQHFAADGLDFQTSQGELAKLWQWLDSPLRFHAAGQGWLRTAAQVLGWLTPASMIAYLVVQQFGIVPLILVLLNLVVIRLTFKSVEELLRQTSEHLPAIKAVAGLVKQIEAETFQSAPLQHLKATVASQTDKSTASQAIRQMGNMIEHIERRENAYFYILFIMHTLWDLRWAIRLEQWKMQHRNDVRRWFEAVGQMDALNSLAGLAFAQPTFTLPEITETPFTLRATALGHPLIAPAKRVVNDYEISGASVCYLITGSNMSGKSTFLRTVGLNAVLAYAGAAVCAKSLTISPMQVFTSMRTQDSLSESVSSFYAELRRIRAMLDQAEAKHDTFYLLDEILKGTNSHDRHTGAKALVRQLQRLGVSGMVSTHDLELASLAEESPDLIRNYHFSSEVVDDQLHFSYQLRTGACQSFNASLLMRQLGIGV